MIGRSVIHKVSPISTAVEKHFVLTVQEGFLFLTLSPISLVFYGWDSV